MKLDKAIEILTINNDHNPNFTDADRRDALKMGVEALKYIQRDRRGLADFDIERLPGETSV